MCQMIIMVALAIKIRSVKHYFDPKLEKDQLLKKLDAADSCAKSLYIVLTAVYLVSAGLLITLSWPIMKIIETETYSIINMTQISLTLSCMVMLLVYLQRKIEFLNEMSGHTFV